ncbi:MAG TPA: TonB-dependent receptor [Gemmatimonadales bacterium]|jgi:vitamin B12 transporter
MNLPLLVLALIAQQPQDTVVLKPVVVTATRVPVAADLVASAVTVLRGTDLVAQGIRTVAQALETVPGARVVETGSFGGQTSLFMRGGESDYTKVLLDGVPLNQAGGAIDLAHLTTDNIDRIEIVRGPVSVLYGTDAVTGVIQVFTRAGQGAARVGADLRAGTYGSTDGAVDIAGGTKAIGYSARVSRFSSDGLYPYNNQYRNSVVSAGLRVAPDPRTDASLSYRYGDDVYHFPTDGTGAPVDSNQRAAERGPLLSLSAGRVLGRHLDVRVAAGVKESRLFYNDEPDSPGEDGAYWSRDYVRRATTSAVLNWRARGGASITGGVEYEDQRQRGTSEFSASFGTFPDSIAAHRNNTGYFTQAIIPTGRAAVTLGSRLDDNSQFGTHATYRGGVVYRLDQVRVRLSVGTGYKEPTFFENFARGGAVGNADLKPERSLSWELGVEHGAVAVTYFNQRFRDLIEYSPTPLGPDSVNYFNVGGAIGDGIEASFDQHIGHRFAVSVQYTYLHTRVEQSGSPDPDGLFVPGKPLIRRPAHMLGLQLAATLGRRAHVTVGARWVGKRDDLDFRRAPGQRRMTRDPYTRVNLSGDYTIGRAVLTGSVDNLCNDQAQEIPGFRPRGRTILLGVRITVD